MLESNECKRKQTLSESIKKSVNQGVSMTNWIL